MLPQPHIWCVDRHLTDSSFSVSHCSAKLDELLHCWVQYPEYAVCQNHCRKPGPLPIGSHIYPFGCDHPRDGNCPWDGDCTNNSDHSIEGGYPCLLGSFVHIGPNRGLYGHTNCAISLVFELLQCYLDQNWMECLFQDFGIWGYFHMLAQCAVSICHIIKYCEISP